MSELRSLLEREGELVSLPPDAADRMFEFNADGDVTAVIDAFRPSC